MIECTHKARYLEKHPIILEFIGIDIKKYELIYEPIPENDPLNPSKCITPFCYMFLINKKTNKEVDPNSEVTKKFEKEIVKWIHTYT